MPQAVRKAIADFDPCRLAQVIVPPQRSIQDTIRDRLHDLVDRSRLRSTCADKSRNVEGVEKLCEECKNAAGSHPEASTMTCTLPEGGLFADITRFDRDSLRKVVLPRSVQDLVTHDLVRDLVYRPMRPAHAAYGETSFYLTEASTDEDEVLVPRTQPTFHPTPHAELLAAIRKRVSKCTRTRTRRRSYVLWRPTPVVDRSPSPVRPVPILRCPDLTLCASLSLSEASEWSDDD